MLSTIGIAVAWACHIVWRAGETAGLRVRVKLD